MGGDEFILVQKSVSSRGDAERMAQRIFEAVSAPYCIDGHDIVIGASIGVAMSPDDGEIGRGVAVAVRQGALSRPRHSAAGLSSRRIWLR